MASAIISPAKGKLIIPIVKGKPQRACPVADASLQSDKLENFQDYYTSPQSSVEEAWKITPPPWLNKKVISEIVTFKSLYEKDHKLLFEHEKIITFLLSDRAEMKREIQELRSENQVSKMDYSFEDLQKMSDENMREIKIALDLPDINDGLSLKDRLQKLDGFLKSYSKDNVNSVDLIREMREDW